MENIIRCNEDQEIDQDNETELDIYMRNLSIVESEDICRGFNEDGELIGCYCKITQDNEQEKLILDFYKIFIPLLQKSITKVDKIIDDSTTPEHSYSYWTQSGDNPVIIEKAFLNDQRDRNINELLPPEKNFYSKSKCLEYKKQHRNYLQWQCLIFKYKDNKSNLLKIMRGFWKAYFRRNPEERKNWLCPWHIKGILNVIKMYRSK